MSVVNWHRIWNLGHVNTAAKRRSKVIFISRLATLSDTEHGYVLRERLPSHTLPWTALRAIVMGAAVAATSVTVPSAFVGLTATIDNCPVLSMKCLYVSPSGNDRGPGSQSQPFKSLVHARDVVRTLNRRMTGNITIFLENGTYRLSQPLQLGQVQEAHSL
jgi:hypothetical protein